MLRTLTGAALVVTLLSIGAAAQNASSVVAAASKAMGVDTLNSITYSGTARNGAVRPEQGHRRADGAGERHASSRTTRARSTSAPSADRAALVSRATGPTQPPTVPGVPAPMPGVFNQNITGMQANTQLEPGAEHLDHAVGLPEGRGGQQRHRPAAGRPAGGVVLAGQPQVAVGAALHGDRLHQQPEPGDQGRNARRATPSSATCWSSSTTRTTRT